MIVSIKDSIKLVGISIMSLCAVFVCTLFLNYTFDLLKIENQITNEVSQIYFDAQLSTAYVVNGVTGGCLVLTTIVMLIFYIKHYIDIHKKELGILKALGKSEFSIAKHFWVFGLSVFIGCVLGFGGAFAFMPNFYALQNKDNILPEITMNFHPTVLVFFVLVPAIVFSLLACLYAFIKLKQPVLNLIKEQTKYKQHKSKSQAKQNDRSFLADLTLSTLKNKKMVAFFIAFASFCFSAMTQMSFSMKDLSSKVMGAMMLIIGLVLAITTMYIAITTAVHSNQKTIAIMQTFGYSHSQCSKTILGCYRPISYFGFALGTVYQYFLLRIMVDLVFNDVANMPEYKFDYVVMLISLAIFVILYELVMYVYSNRIKKISIKQIMLE